MMNRWKSFAALGLVFLLSACTSIPPRATPVEPFDVSRYMGTWYEIARFDFRFERNMDNVMAQYALKENGSVAVVNSGYHNKDKKWKKATAKAKFRGKKEVGALKVSFFGPFYSGYNVIAIDPDYQYALVAGKNVDYLWILSRTPNLPEQVKEEYLKKAEAIGYDLSRLVWVAHNRNDNPYLEKK